MGSIHVKGYILQPQGGICNFSSSLKIGGYFERLINASQFFPFFRTNKLCFCQILAYQRLHVLLQSNIAFIGQHEWMLMSIASSLFIMLQRMLRVTILGHK